MASNASRTAAASTISGIPAFETLKLSEPAPAVLEVAMNRPDKHNAMNRVFWEEITQAFDWAGESSDVRAVILSGGDAKHFTAGIDLMDHVELLSPPGEGEDVSRRAWALRKHIRRYQESFSSIERCPKPVIAAIHGACIGGGVDMVCAADVRLASSDAFFCVKEVEIGLAADVGTLQRLPRVVGNDSWVREACLTARNIPAEEAAAHGLLSRVHVDRRALRDDALRVATTVASLSPVAVQGTKINLNYARGRTVEEALEYQSVWNASMLQSADLAEAAQASMTGEDPRFSKL